MYRTFVMTQVFDRKWTALGLRDDALADLQTALQINPDEGDVLQGTHGLRKVRWALPGKGKSGGLRIFYADFPRYEVTFLVTLLQKNEAANLDKAERNALGLLLQSIERSLKERFPKGGLS
jgi:hypothetical protein